MPDEVTLLDQISVINQVVKLRFVGREMVDYIY